MRGMSVVVQISGHIQIRSRVYYVELSVYISILVFKESHTPSNSFSEWCSSDLFCTHTDPCGPQCHRINIYRFHMQAKILMLMFTTLSWMQSSNMIWVISTAHSLVCAFTVRLTRIQTKRAAWWLSAEAGCDSAEQQSEGSLALGAWITMYCQQ